MGACGGFIVGNLGQSSHIDEGEAPLRRQDMAERQRSPGQAPPLGGSNAIVFEIAVRENRTRLLVGNLKPHLNAGDALWASEAAINAADA